MPLNSTTYLEVSPDNIVKYGEDRNGFYKKMSRLGAHHMRCPVDYCWFRVLQGHTDKGALGWYRDDFGADLPPWISSGMSDLKWALKFEYGVDPNAYTFVEAVSILEAIETDTSTIKARDYFDVIDWGSLSHGRMRNREMA